MVVGLALYSFFFFTVINRLEDQSAQKEKNKNEAKNIARTTPRSITNKR